MDQKSIEQKGSELASAIERGNGLDASRVLREVGSCGWSDVFDDAKKKIVPKDQTTLSTSGYSGSDTERVFIYINPLSQTAFAGDSGPSCKKK